MKVLRILVLILGFVILVKAQTNDKSVLTGTVYDAAGAVVPGVKVTATNEKGLKFEAQTNVDGVYVFKLPFNSFDAKASSGAFRTAKYEIIVDLTNLGFEKFVLKDFKFVPSYTGKMNLDIALDVIKSDCDAGGCGENEPPPIETNKREIPDEILQTRPLEELPKEQNKPKRKKKNNRQ